MIPGLGICGVTVWLSFAPMDGTSQTLPHENRPGFLTVFMAAFTWRRLSTKRLSTCTVRGSKMGDEETHRFGDFKILIDFDRFWISLSIIKPSNLSIIFWTNPTAPCSKLWRICFRCWVSYCQPAEECLLRPSRLHASSQGAGPRQATEDPPCQNTKQSNINP